MPLAESVQILVWLTAAASVVATGNHKNNFNLNNDNNNNFN